MNTHANNKKDRTFFLAVITIFFMAVSFWWFQQQKARMLRHAGKLTPSKRMQQNLYAQCMYIPTQLYFVAQIDVGIVPSYASYLFKQIKSQVNKRRAPSYQSSLGHTSRQIGPRNLVRTGVALPTFTLQSQSRIINVDAPVSSRKFRAFLLSYEWKIYKPQKLRL